MNYFVVVQVFVRIHPLEVKIELAPSTLLRSWNGLQPSSGRRPTYPSNLALVLYRLLDGNPTPAPITLPQADVLRYNQLRVVKETNG